jgi:uncharacterized OB-fold protein
MTPHYLPVPDVLSSRFWQGTRERMLMIQRCPVTGRHQWYPRTHSIHAPGALPEWVRASGRGTLFTWSVIHRGNGTTPTPYTCAVVELEEGVLFTSTLKGVSEGDIRIGMPLEVDFEEAGPDLVLPFFRPVAKP